MHIDHAGLQFSDPCWRWIWAAFRAVHAAGQPGGLMPPERNPAGTTPAGQPVELPAVRELLIKEGHWEQVRGRLYENDYPRNSIKYGEWRWGKVM